jgi:hypothetical protein
MAEELKRPVGAVDELEIRRIGVNHAVVLPPRQATLLDVGEMRREVTQITRRLAAMEDERVRLTALLQDRNLIVAQFDAAKIDRIDGDPEVPQPAVPVDALAVAVDAVPVDAVAVAVPAPRRGG